MDGDPATSWRSGGQAARVARDRLRRETRVRRPDDRVGARPVRAPLRRRDLRRRGGVDAGANRRSGQRRPRRSLPARVGVAIRPVDDPRSGRRTGDRRPRDRRPAAGLVGDAERFLRGDRARGASRNVSAVLLRRAVVLDRRRRRRRHGECPAGRGRRGRTVARLLLRRAVPLPRRKALLLERRGDRAVAGTRRSADPDRDLAARRVEPRDHRVRLRKSRRRLVPPGALSRSQLRPGAPRREALPRGAPLPGQSAGAVPERSGRRRANRDPGMGRLGGGRGRGAARHSRAFRPPDSERLPSTEARSRTSSPGESFLRRRACATVSATPPALSRSTSILPRARPTRCRSSFQSILSLPPGRPPSPGLDPAAGVAPLRGRSRRRRAGVAAQARPGRIAGTAGGGPALSDASKQPGVRPDRARRPGAAPGDARLRALVDSRRRDDLGGPPAAGPPGGRARLHRVVREVPGCRRPGALLRGPARRGRRPRKRQPRRASLSHRGTLALHAGRGFPAEGLSARRGRRRVHRRPPAETADGGVSRAREAAVLRPPSRVDQPRGVLGQARALLLGRLLGAQGLEGRRGSGRRSGP